MFLKEAFEMTDIVKKFNLGDNTLQRGMKAQVLEKATINLRDVFARRDIFFGNDGNTNAEM